MRTFTLLLGSVVSLSMIGVAGAGPKKPKPPDGSVDTGVISPTVSPQVRRPSTETSGTLAESGDATGRQVFAPRAGRPPRLDASQIDETATRISEGHAFDKHVLNTEPRNRPFSEIGVTDRASYRGHISDVLSSPTTVSSRLSEHRTKYWHEPSGTFAIRNTNDVDMGTAFRPKSGFQYYMDVR